MVKKVCLLGLSFLFVLCLVLSFGPTRTSMNVRNKNRKCPRSPSYLKQVRALESIQWYKTEFTPMMRDDPVFQRPSLQFDHQNYRRFVYLDVGVKNPKGSMRQFSHSPLFRERAFEIFGFEANPKYFERISKASYPPHTITLVPYAVWVCNQTMTFSGVMAQLKVAGQREDLLPAEKTAAMVTEGIDFSEWIYNHISHSDFVILKMDIEEAEYTVIPHLISTGAICLLDELFVEFHFSRLQMTRPGRQNRTHNWEDVVSLAKSVTNTDTYLHLWF